MFPPDAARNMRPIDSTAPTDHRGMRATGSAFGEDSMPLAYWCVLIAALLPIVWISYAKAGTGGDNRHPRDALESLPAAKRRAYAAHQNAYENFPFFAAAVLSAPSLGAPMRTVNILAALYIAVRIAHGVLYIADQARLRSMAYLVALLFNIAIFVLPAFG
jgi:uncharacterized MAPEG superfamily protein